MMRSLLVLALLAAAAPCRAAPALKMVTIDTEEGAATLFVTPQGRSLLIDTGSPAGSDPKSGLDGARNGADRIAAAARSLGVRRIDDVIITHYHGGHVGGVVELLARLPVGTFIDHGPDREMADPRKPGDAPANAGPARHVFSMRNISPQSRAIAISSPGRAMFSILVR